ncbi:type 1 glutamine amidotransferase [Commensalibacter oyaizuii]|uniref:Type 1 glutamine amidotransferase n=1 Tax=Commensalibacter oyaizuii TaxID=3043873 RepID=A0ABT6PYE0_9PROT|nr:type 1 glutamine amidotransferase [Commensalibacter sp. TBRC 16381]MDI2089881.1 type 1 glutamine amidotransferase [Commensalibacter sp. TBRC 16381]
MKAIILQHASHEGPGYILSWLHEQGFTTDICFLYKSKTELPDILNTNLLIVLGGPMSVHDEATYPWLKKEKKLIKKAIENNIPTLGICFGAQLIASIYGAEIKSAPQKEIGWFPIQAVEHPKKKTFRVPQNFNTLLWHQDKFDMPEGGVLLASNDMCPNIAFQINKNVIGLQCHSHITPYLLQAMINNYSSVFTNDPYIQSPQQLLSAPTSFFIQNNQLIDDVLSYILAKGKPKHPSHPE